MRYISAPSAAWFLPHSLARVYTSDDRICFVYASNTSLVWGHVTEESGFVVNHVTRHAHTDRVTSVVCIDTCTVVSTAFDGYVNLWKLNDSLEATNDKAVTDSVERESICFIRHLNKHDIHKENSVVTADTIFASNCVVSIDQKGCIVVWEVATMVTRRVDVLCKRRKLPRITDMAVSLHEKYLCIVADDSGLIHVVSLSGDGKIVHKIEAHNADVIGLSWCPSAYLNMFWTDQDSSSSNKLNTNQDTFFCSVSCNRYVKIWSRNSGKCVSSTILPSRKSTPANFWYVVNWHSYSSLLLADFQGTINQLDLTKDAKITIKSLISFHTKPVASLCYVNLESGAHILTTSNDRRIALSPLIGEVGSQPQHVMPTIGGSCYAMRLSHLNTDQLVVASGDQCLNFIDLKDQSNGKKATTFSKYVKCKILTIDCHKELNLVAFGTERGYVGVYDCDRHSLALSSESLNQPVVAVLFSTCTDTLLSLSAKCVHSHTVSRNNVTTASRLFCDHAQHHCYNDVTQMTFMRTTDSGDSRRILALGRQSGSVVFIRLSDETVGSTVAFHKSVYSIISFRDFVDIDESLKCDVFSLAVGHKSGTVSIFTFSSFDEMCQLSIQPRFTLSQHSNAVVSLDSNCSRDTHLLVSASLDATVCVWDIHKVECISIFSLHQAPVRCCLFHPLLDDVIISGGDDSSVIQWDMKDFPLATCDISLVKQDNNIEATKKKKKKKRNQNCEKTDASENHLSSSSLLHSSKSSDIALNNINENSIQHKPEKKAQTVKTLFPVVKNMESGGKCSVFEDLEYMFNVLTCSDSSYEQAAEDRYTHLGLYLNEELCDKHMDLERSQFSKSENNAALLYAHMFYGDISSYLTQLAEESRLNDTAVALAPMVSYRFWQDICVKYCNQLEAGGNVLKAAIFLLNCHKLEDALSLLLRHFMFYEALALCKRRLPPHSSYTIDILTKWTDHSLKHGNWQQAVKCLLVCGEYSQVCNLLATRTDLYSRILAARIAWYLDEIDVTAEHSHTVEGCDNSSTRKPSSENSRPEAKFLHTKAVELSQICVHECCLHTEWSLLNKLDQFLISKPLFKKWRLFAEAYRKLFDYFTNESALNVGIMAWICILFECDDASATGDEYLLDAISSVWDSFGELCESDCADCIRSFDILECKTIGSGIKRFILLICSDVCRYTLARYNRGLWFSYDKISLDIISVISNVNYLYALAFASLFTQSLNDKCWLHKDFSKIMLPLMLDFLSKNSKNQISGLKGKLESTLEQSIPLNIDEVANVANNNDNHKLIQCGLDACNSDDNADTCVAEASVVSRANDGSDAEEEKCERSSKTCVGLSNTDADVSNSTCKSESSTDDVKSPSLAKTDRIKSYCYQRVSRLWNGFSSM